MYAREVSESESDKELLIEVSGDVKGEEDICGVCSSNTADGAEDSTTEGSRRLRLRVVRERLMVGSD